MWFRTIALTMSAMAILATSFCTHKHDVRNVSSEELNVEFEGVEPLIVTSAKHHQLIVFEKMHNSRSASMLVKFQCANSQASVVWDEFNVEVFMGLSEVLEGSIVRLRYKPLAVLDMISSSTKQSEVERQASLPLDKVYDLALACP